MEAENLSGMPSNYAEQGWPDQIPAGLRTVANTAISSENRFTRCSALRS